MVSNPCTLKLRHIMSLSKDEEAVLAEIEDRTTPIDKATDLIVQGEKDGAIHVIRNGWALRYRHLTDGRRQILNFLLPGDWIGLTSIMFDESDHCVTTVTETVTCRLTPQDVFRLSQEQPRLAVGIYWMAAQEEAVIAEHLVDVGRRSAFERLGHMFLELFLRLEAVGVTSGNSFDFPLNQVVLADALGLSQVHVNRTLQRLRRDGLLEVNGRHATILDQPALERAVDFEKTYLHLAGLPVWLRRRFDARGPQIE